MTEQYLLRKNSFWFIWPLTLLLLVYPACVWGQASPSATSAKPDPSTFLRALKASGWLPSAKSGVILTGSVARLPGESLTDRQVRVWAKGSSKFRIEIDDANGTSSSTFDGSHGSHTPAGKDSAPTSLHSSQSAEQWMLPWISLEPRLKTHELTKLLPSTIDGQPVLGYTFEPKAVNDNSGNKSVAVPLYDSTFTVWISAASGLPVQIDYFVPSTTNRFAGVHASRQYQDFKSIDGVQIPNIEIVQFEGSAISQLKINTMQLSDDVTDDHFAAANTEKGGK